MVTLLSHFYWNEHYFFSNGTDSKIWALFKWVTYQQEKYTENYELNFFFDSLKWVSITQDVSLNAHQY